jgi:hypothetical protein
MRSPFSFKYYTLWAENKTLGPWRQRKIGIFFHKNNQKTLTERVHSCKKALLDQKLMTTEP